MNLNTLLKPYYVEGQNEPDITSVLKFINRQKRLFVPKLLPAWNTFWIWFIKQDKYDVKFNQKDSIWEFLNKPLTFYTKTELTDLENLLTKLK